MTLRDRVRLLQREVIEETIAALAAKDDALRTAWGLVSLLRESDAKKACLAKIDAALKTSD